MAGPDYRTCASAGITALQRWYHPATGLWQGTGWWNSANALTAVIRYTKLTGDGRHAGVISTTFTAAQRQHANFVNTYYDDNAWWALAWIAAFDLTRDQRYLEAARTIFARNTAAWDDSCGGGLRWHAAEQLQERDHQRAVLHPRRPTAPAQPRAGGLPDLGATRLGMVQREVVFIGPVRPGQRRDHHVLPEQRRDHLDLQPGRDPGRSGRAVRDHR